MGTKEEIYIIHDTMAQHAKSNLNRLHKLAFIKIKECKQ